MTPQDSSLVILSGSRVPWVGQYVSSFRSCREASLVAQPVKNPPAMQETQVRFLGWEDPLQEGTATHSSILAWRTAWTEEPGGLQSMELQSLTWLRTLSFSFPSSAQLTQALISTSAAAAAKSLQSCPTLCDPIDGSPSGFAVPGILQARTLEWVAISFSNAWNWRVKVKLLSRVRSSATPWTAAFQAPPSMGFSRQEYWSGVPLPSPHIYLYHTSKGILESLEIKNRQVYHVIQLLIIIAYNNICKQTTYFIKLSYVLLFVVVQSLSHVWLLATPWILAQQASLFLTVSQNLLKLMSIESVMLSNYLILCCPLLYPLLFCDKNNSSLGMY